MTGTETAPSVSIVLPCLNEAEGLRRTLPKLREVLPDAEIVVVDDGSTDGSGDIAREHGCTVVRHPFPRGNGAAVKAGTRAASGEVLVFMDSDGQHDPLDIPRLVARLDEGYEMAVGARTRTSQASWWRGLANRLYNGLASYMVNRRIEDLTSGFRAVRASCFRQFLHLLPNGFSYPTTSTMAFFRAGYAVAYEPIEAAKRVGNPSHIRILRDGLRFLVIISRIGTLYSPLKVFIPISLLAFALACANYAYTLSTIGRFTNMSALMFTASVLFFLIGLVSEQITMLLYAAHSRDGD